MAKEEKELRYGLILGLFKHWITYCEDSHTTLLSMQFGFNSWQYIVGLGNTEDDFKMKLVIIGNQYHLLSDNKRYLLSERTGNKFQLSIKNAIKKNVKQVNDLIDYTDIDI